MSSFVSANGPSMTRLLPAGEPDALALAARVEAVARQHDAGLDQLFVELAHVGEQLLARHHPASEFFVALTITMTRIVCAPFVGGRSRPG